MFERFTWELRATLSGNDARDTGITHIRPHVSRPPNNPDLFLLRKRRYSPGLVPEWSRNEAGAQTQHQPPGWPSKSSISWMTNTMQAPRRRQHRSGSNDHDGNETQQPKRRRDTAGVRRPMVRRDNQPRDRPSDPDQSHRERNNIAQRAPPKAGRMTGNATDETPTPIAGQPREHDDEPRRHPRGIDSVPQGRGRGLQRDDGPPLDATHRDDRESANIARTGNSQTRCAAEPCSPRVVPSR